LTDERVRFLAWLATVRTGGRGLRRFLKSRSWAVLLTLLPLVLCGGCFYTVESFLASEERQILFRFVPRQVTFDGQTRGLDDGWLRFPPGDAVHLLEYERPDGSLVRVELDSRRDDDTDVQMEVEPGRVTGVPRHRVLSVTPPRKIPPSAEGGTGKG